MKIVLAEKVSPATLAVLQQEPDWQIVTADKIKSLPDELADADALVVRSAVQVDAKLLESAPKLRLIGRAGVGVDNIDTSAATHSGIVVMNTPGANAVAVAELTLGLMIAMCRSIPRANSSTHAGKWEKKTLQGSELRGKTLGIIGLGRIGLEVARRARAFGMELLGYDPFIAPVVARENQVTLVPIDEIFKSADFLTLHVGLTPQTEGLINATSLAIMKKGVRIINCARGELIVDEALADAIRSGQVAGAALDVFRAEPLKDSQYFGLDQVLLSPHVAGSTDEAQEAIGIQLAMQVRDYLKLGVVQNAVNLPSLSHEEYQELAPYIGMAERLGRFLSHSVPGNLESIQITYAGRLSRGKTELIRNAAIAGLLAESEGSSEATQPNRINAAAIAQERGIRLQEDRKEVTTGGSGSTLKLTLHSSGGDASATATVLHGTSPRLLTYDGIDIEAPLNGMLVTIRNQDVPGVIGRIGTILGEHKLNIANFALGRAAINATASRGTRVPQGQALAVVQVDAASAAEAAPALDALRKTDAISNVRLVELDPA
jgi:D-3-phosphoglycerate dehydrogenase